MKVQITITFELNNSLNQEPDELIGKLEELAHDWIDDQNEEFEWDYGEPLIADGTEPTVSIETSGE